MDTLKILLQILDEHLRLISSFVWIKISGKFYSPVKTLLKAERWASNHFAIEHDFFFFSDAIACLIMLAFVEGELLAGNVL